MTLTPPGEGSARIGVGADLNAVFAELSVTHRFDDTWAVFARGEAGWAWEKKQPHLFLGAGAEGTW